MIDLFGLEKPVFAVDQGEVLADDPDDPMRTFMRQVLGAVAQLDAAMIAVRLRRGRKLKADKGGYAYGGPPYGYRAEAGALVEDADEMAVVKRIVEYKAKGRSLRDIASALNQEGVRPKRSEQWHPYTVKRILDRTG
jgi:DNA invertase Pin-like site-specific DNA recombinase